MTVFQPQAERLNLSFPVIFSSDDDTVTGSCLNISPSGLSSHFVRPVDLWATGHVSLETGKGTVTLPARVARTNEREAGLAFILHTDVEREAVRDLVAFAAANTQLTGGRPL